MANIGVQLMMVKNEIGDQGMYPVLERIAELGYRSVEVSQVATDEANIAAARVTPRELVQLKNSLFAVELLKAALESTDNAQLHALAGQIDQIGRAHV